VRESPQIREAMLRFYDRRGAADADAYDELVAAEVVHTVGTGPGERFDDREVIRGHFATPGVSFMPGAIVAYEDGDVGWAFDEPTADFGPVHGVPLRVTAVLRREDGRWKIVHLHFSAAVPDEELARLTAG
jgi:ketosteroid isomerase-like protein